MWLLSFAWSTRRAIERNGVSGCLEPIGDVGQNISIAMIDLGVASAARRCRLDFLACRLILAVAEDKLLMSVETWYSIRPAFVSCVRGTTD